MPEVNEDTVYILGFPRLVTLFNLNAGYGNLLLWALTDGPNVTPNHFILDKVLNYFHFTSTAIQSGQYS